MAGQLFDCHMYPVFGPVLVGLQKPSPYCAKLMGCNLLSVQCIKWVSHSVKVGLWTYPWFWAYPHIYTSALVLLYSTVPVGAFC